MTRVKSSIFFLFTFLLLLTEAVMMRINPLSPFYLIALSVGLYLALFQFKYAIFVLLVLMSNVFGVFSAMGLPPIRTPFGTFHVKDIAFLMLIFPLLLDLFNRNVPGKKNILSLPIILLLALTLIQILRGLFILHEDIHYILRLARPFTYYALFFVFIYKINNEKLFDFVIKAILFIGFISAIVGITQVLFGVSLGGSKIEMTVYGSARTYQPNLLFTLFGFFILLTNPPKALNSRLNLFKFIYCIATVIFILLTFSRGLWFIFCFTLIIFYLFGVARTRIFKHAFVSCIILLLVFFITPSFFKHFSYILLARAQTGFHDLRFREGTLGTRMNTLGYCWNYAKKANILFGVGFKYGKIRGYIPKEPASIIIQKDPHRWMGTNSEVGNILFRHGLAGIFLYVFLYYKFFKKWVYCYLNILAPHYKGLMKAILIINITALLLSIISQPFTNPGMLIVLLISWFMFEYIQKEGSK